MAGFDERKRGEESKYAHDQEFLFKVRNRRNKLFGLWLAGECFGKTGDEAMQYAKDVVMADFDLPGDEDIFTKVQADLTAAGKDMSRHLLEKHLLECEKSAREQVMQE